MSDCRECGVDAGKNWICQKCSFGLSPMELITKLASKTMGVSEEELNKKLKESH